MEIIDLENVILLLLSIISGLLGAIFTVAKVSSCLTTFLGIISILFLILSAIHEINENKYRETKRKYYSEFFNNLSSIRKSLEKILYKNTNTLPDNYKNKIIDLLDKMEEILDEPAWSINKYWIGTLAIVYKGCKSTTFIIFRSFEFSNSIYNILYFYYIIFLMINAGINGIYKK